jgi:arylsulfatase A-like enzyme
MKILIKVILFSILIVSLISFSSQPEMTKPNIVFILADDLGYGDLSCYGQQKFKTPNIDQLASSGMKFTTHYAGSCVCAPSRCSIMTGLHTGHSFIRDNRDFKEGGQWPLPDSTFTLAHLFKKNGYVTGAFGKWGLGYWQNSGSPINQGFDEFFGYLCQRNAHHYYPTYIFEDNTKLHLMQNMDSLNGCYVPNLIHEKAIKFIEENKDKPFFLYYPSIIPHAELKAPDTCMLKHIGKYEPEKSFIWTDYGNKKYKKGSYGSQANCHACMATMLNILDNQVGDILSKLEELGIDDHTMVVFTSDNGPHEEGGADPRYFNSSGGLRGVKRDLYEGGIRVPLLVMWKGKIKAGSCSDHVSAFWDMLPTFSDILQEKPLTDIDGISFWPTLSGEGIQKEHDYLYWEFRSRGGRQAIRKEKWKGVRYDVRKKRKAPIELYDLEKDPSETINVADNYPEIVKELELLFVKARKESKEFKW